MMHSELFPNQFVNARLLLDMKRRRHSCRPPPCSVAQKATFVYVVKDDQTVAVRPVNVGTAQGEETLDRTGLSPGELRRRRWHREIARRQQGRGAAQSGPAAGRSGDPTGGEPKGLTQGNGREPVPPLHSAAGGHVLIDGGDSPRRGRSPIASCRFRPFPKSITRPSRS